MPDLGLYDYRNRAYSPELGRFLQTDPKSFDADPSNLYRYCGNEPIDRTDPMGLEENNYGYVNPFYRQSEHLSASEQIERNELANQNSIAGERAFQAIQAERYARAESASRGGGGFAGGGGVISARQNMAYLVYRGRWTEDDKEHLEHAWNEKYQEWKEDAIEHEIRPVHRFGLVFFGVTNVSRRELSLWQQLVAAMVGRGSKPQDDKKTLRDLMQKRESIKNKNREFRTGKTDQRLRERLKQIEKDPQSMDPED